MKDYFQIFLWYACSFFLKDFATLSPGVYKPFLGELFSLTLVLPSIFLYIKIIEVDKSGDTLDESKGAYKYIYIIPLVIIAFIITMK